MILSGIINTSTGATGGRELGVMIKELTSLNQHTKKQVLPKTS